MEAPWRAGRVWFLESVEEERVSRTSTEVLRLTKLAGGSAGEAAKLLMRWYKRQGGAEGRETMILRYCPRWKDGFGVFLAGVATELRVHETELTIGHSRKPVNIC